jgi:Cu+-exporting ATPase
VAASLPPPGSGLECVILLDGVYAATYRFHDAAREDSRSFIDHLKPRHRLDRILLVSGDRESEVRYLADRVGIVEVHAGCTPEEKVAITRAETARAPTLFIGDGINDAPALAQADLGIAIGTGTDIAMEASDVTLIRGDLRGVVTAIELSRRTMRTIRLNLFWAFCYNVVGIPIAAGVLYPLTGILLSPVIASAAMAWSSLSVVLNSLTLRRFEPEWR